MAERKRPDLGPGNDAVQPDDTDRLMYALPPNQMNTAVRATQNLGRENVAQFRDVLAGHVARLRIRRTAPVLGMPAGSDQVDMQSLYVWAAKVGPNDDEAKRQIGQLYACCLARLGG